MKIAIVGTGAMGSVYASLLGKAGHEVWAIDTWQDHLDAIATSGLSVSGASGSFVVDNLHVGRPSRCGPVRRLGDRDQGGRCRRGGADIAPLLGPDSVVMAFQNGLGAGERVARRIPQEHIVIGIAEGFGSSIPEPGHVHHEGMRLIRIGEMNGGLTARVQQHRAGLPRCRLQCPGLRRREPDDLGEVPLQRHAQRTVCRLRRHRRRADVGRRGAEGRSRLHSEAYRLGVARGVQFPFDDPLEYVTEFAATIPNASPSMRLDHLARRRSEIDVINGQVVELSRQFGLETPYNETLCAVLRRREALFA